MADAPVITDRDISVRVASLASPNQLPSLIIASEPTGGRAYVQYRIIDPDDPAEVIAGPYVTAIGDIEVDVRALLARRMPSRFPPETRDFGPGQIVKVDETARIRAAAVAKVMSLTSDGSPDDSPDSNLFEFDLFDTDRSSSGLYAAPLTALSPLCNQTMPRTAFYFAVFAGQGSLQVAYGYDVGGGVNQVGGFTTGEVHVVRIPYQPGATVCGVTFGATSFTLRYDQCLSHVIWGLLPSGGWVQAAYQRKEVRPSPPQAVGRYAYPRPEDRLSPRRPGEAVGESYTLTRARIPVDELPAYRDLATARQVFAEDRYGNMAACDVTAISDVDVDGASVLTLSFRPGNRITP